MARAPWRRPSTFCKQLGSWLGWVYRRCRNIHIGRGCFYLLGKDHGRWQPVATGQLCSCFGGLDSRGRHPSSLLEPDLLMNRQSSTPLARGHRRGPWPEFGSLIACLHLRQSRCLESQPCHCPRGGMRRMEYVWR